MLDRKLSWSIFTFRKLYSKTSNGSKRTSTKKKTPKSAKRPQRCSPVSTTLQASSKRALFTSPVSQSTEHKKLPRRTLFSPINDENKKRKLETSPKQDSDQDRQKQRRIGSPSKLPKSQSFSIASSTSYDTSFRKKLFPKTQSEIILQSSDSSSNTVSLGFKGALDEVVKQKILWSVSTALNSKQISKNHESFKELASTLAKLVKKIFLEFHLPGKSISSSLQYFASQMVHFVINGHPSDQVYKNTKELLETKNLKQNKPNLLKNHFLTASHSSMELSQKSEYSIEEVQSENKSRRRFGSDSNLSSNMNILKAKRQISF